MKKFCVLVGSVALAGAAVSAVDVEKDIWFLADFDTPARLNGEAYLQEMDPSGYVEGKFGKGFHFYRETNNKLPPMKEFFAKPENFAGDPVELRADSLGFKGGTFSVTPRGTGIGYHWVGHDAADTWSVYVKGAKGTKLTLWPELTEISAADLKAVKKNKDWKYDEKNAQADVAVTNEVELCGDWQRVSCHIVTDNRTAGKRKVSLNVKASGPVVMKQFQLQVTGVYPFKGRFDPGMWVDGGRSGRGSPIVCSDAVRLATFPYEAGSFAFWVKNAPGVPEKTAINAWSFAKAWSTQWGLGPSNLYTGEPGFSCGVKGGVPRRAEWTHVAGVWSKDRLAVYVNGELVGERVAGTDPKTKRKTEVKIVPQEGNRGTFRVGAFGDGSGPTDAIMDEFAIFSRVLTEAEIRELVNAKRGFCEGTTKLLADNLLFRTFYRNEENAAIRLTVWSPKAGEYELKSRFARAPLPDRTVSLPAGLGQITVPFDPSQVRPGKHPYSFELRTKGGEVALAQSGEVTVRGRLERDAYLFHNWGGMGYVHHAFGDVVGINCYNVGSGNKLEVRKIVEHGAYPNIRYENGGEWFKQDFDWAGIRAKAKKDLAYASGLHAWVSTLLNSEIYGSGVAQRAKDNPKYIAMAKEALGVEPEFTYGTAPSEVNWKKLGKEPPRGVIGHDYSPTLETLNWVMAKGMPLFYSNKETVKAIHEVQPGNTVWSEPLGGGVAASVDMGADWIYQYSTKTTLWELYAQYSGCRASGRPYMPTLGGCYWPTQNGRHPVLKTKDGKPQTVEVAQGADEVIVKTWMSIGAVPAHHLSFFGLDAWEYGVSNALKFAASPTNSIKQVSEPDVAERYGKAWYADLAPAAELLRDMPNARADVAFLSLPEIEHAAGFWWGHYHYSTSLRGALAEAGVPFDVIGAAETKAETLAKYRYVVLPMARVIYRERADELRKAAELGTVIVQDSYATNHYPNEVWLKDLKYTPGQWGKMKAPFCAWYTNQVHDLRARAFAFSKTDGQKSFTFTKEYKGAKYVVVVNDARDPKPSFLNQFKTNDWYRVVGEAQRIQTAVKCADDDAAIYLFNGHGRDFSEKEKKGYRVLTGEFGPAEGRVYCVYPKKLKDPELALEGEAKPGAKATLVVRISDEDGKPAPGRQIVELKLVDGMGNERDESGRYAVEDGVARITVRFAKDEQTTGLFSKWKATVTDLTTGEDESLKFAVGK